MLKISFFDWLINNTDNFTRIYEPAEGLFCPLHIILMITLGIWLCICPFLFRKYRDFSKKFVLYLAVIMLVWRVTRIIMEISIGGKSFVEEMPWHLCHIMCFCLGIATIYNYFSGGKLKGRWILASVCIFGFFGGLMTFGFGDYYQYKEMSFYELESLYLHYVIPTLAVYHVSVHNTWFTFKNITQSLFFLCAMILYGWLGNWLILGIVPFSTKESVFFDENLKPTVNVMFMRFNALPFKFQGIRHYWTYLFMIACAYLSGYAACTVLWIRKQILISKD
jgi:hypothetical protein